MTDIDIERLRRAATPTTTRTRTDECIYRHMDCAVLALIERLKTAEKEREAIWDEVLAELKHAWPDEPMRYNSSPLELIGDLIGERDELQEQNAALRQGKPIGPVIGAQALLRVTQQRDRLAELVEEAYEEGCVSAAEELNEYFSTSFVKKELDRIIGENKTDE